MDRQETERGYAMQSDDKVINFTARQEAHLRRIYEDDPILCADDVRHLLSRFKHLRLKYKHEFACRNIAPLKNRLKSNLHVWACVTCRGYLPERLRPSCGYIAAEIVDIAASDSLAQTGIHAFIAGMDSAAKNMPLFGLRVAADLLFLSAAVFRREIAKANCYTAMARCWYEKFCDHAAAGSLEEPNPSTDCLGGVQALLGQFDTMSEATKKVLEDDMFKPPRCLP